VVDVDLAESVALGNLASLAWSPGGSQLLYTTFEEPTQSPSLMLADANGSSARPLGPGSWPAWSPDGTQIVFSSVRDWPGLEILEVTTGVTRTLVDRSVVDWLFGPATAQLNPSVETPTWSLAGDWIAFAVNLYETTGPVQGGLAVVHPDGSDLRPLLGHTGGIYVSQWAPDGRWVLSLAYSGDQITTTVTAVDGQALFEATALAGGSLSPDGRYVAIVEGDRMPALRVVEIETGISNVFELPASCVSPAWNPRGPLHEAVQDYGVDERCG